MPYAAKFGHSEQDLDDHDLENRLRDNYARSFGYDPAGNWILIVHADNTTEFFRFEEPSEMWCCARREEIGAMLDAEVRAMALPESDS